METVTVKEKKTVLNPNFRGFSVVANLIKGMTCFIFTIVILSMGGNVLNTIHENNQAGDYALGGAIYGLFSNVSLIFYVALFIAFAGTLTLTMFKVKTLPMPPVEDLSVDMLLVTLAGLSIATLATVGGGLFVVLITALILMYLPATRLYRHLAWWFKEMPVKKSKKVA